MNFVTVYVFENDTFRSEPLAFTAEVATSKEARRLEARLSYTYRWNDQVEVRATTVNDTTHASHYTRDWALSGEGTHVPMHVDELDGNLNHSCIIRFEDPSYMRYYSDNLYLPSIDYDETDEGEWAYLSHEYAGWMLEEIAVVNARQFVRTMNSYHIPMSDTLEWDAYHDGANGRVLFFPHFPEHVGSQMEGDTFTPFGVWNDTLRAFVFTEEDWLNIMSFYGYSC